MKKLCRRDKSFFCTIMKKLLTFFIVALTLLFSIPNIQIIKAADSDNNTGTTTSTTSTGSDTSTSTIASSGASSTSSWYNQSFQEWYDKVFDTSNPSEIFGERYTAAQVQWIIYSLQAAVVNGIVGPSGTDFVRCVLTNNVSVDTCGSQLNQIIPKTIDSSKLSQVNGFMNPRDSKQNSFLSLVFATNRPLSGIAYVKGVVDKLNPVSNVHAATAGFGYSALSPVLHMWTAARNFAFTIFVIATIVIAFMIMFRVKISPQVVISIQSALPKIIGGLILVTFSYAIAGFLVDLLYVVIGIVSLFLPSMITGTGVGFTAAQAFNWMTVGPLGIGIVFSMLIYIIFFIITLLVALVLNLGAISTGLAAYGIGAGASAITSAASTTIAATGAAAGGVTIGAILGPILIAILVIVGVVIIFHLFKIWWSLLKAFASILLLTIVAPIQIAAGVVIPNFGFTAWLKSFASALSTFVVTGVLMFMSYAFLVQAWIRLFHDWTSVFDLLFGSALSSTITASTAGATAQWPPLLGGGNSNAGIAMLFVGVSFVIFTLIPKANEIIQGFITGRPYAYGNAFSEIASTAKNLWGTTGGLYMKSAQEELTRPRLESFKNVIETARTNAEVKRKKIENQDSQS